MKLHLVKKIAAGVALTAAATGASAEWSANAGVANNYLWRGLTQTVNEPVISGGIDYAHESGFYAGTWAANVQYTEDSEAATFAYEHDLYFGFSGEAGGMSYDIGYLYYNYNEDAAFDFSEVYGTLGFGDFSVTAYILAHAQPDEEDFVAEGGGEADFGFGSAYYLSFDYGFELGDGWTMGLHAGYHDGDFVEAFNFADATTYDYVDYNVSFAKDAFSFTVSSTDLDEESTSAALSNDDIKYVVSYTFEI
jgi:uncharacterized protein (TIGR02001 family)